MVDPVLLDPAGIGGETIEGYVPEKAWRGFITRINTVQQFHKDCLSEGHYHKPSHYFYAERIRTFSSVRWRLPSHACRFEKEAILNGRPGPADGLGSNEILVILHDAMTGKVVSGNVHFGTKCRVPVVLQGPDGAGDGTVPVESGNAPSRTIAHGIAADEHRFDHEAAYKEILTQVYTLLAICKLAGTPTL
jgi:hypothetical protein